MAAKGKWPVDMPAVHNTAWCLQVADLPVFWKQQHMLFFDSVSFAVPSFLVRIPFSLASSVAWAVITYFPVGLAGEPSRYTHPTVRAPRLLLCACCT